MTRNQLQYWAQVEDKRRNAVNERLAQWQFEEQQRVNAEQARANRARESLTREGNLISSMSLQEQKRSHLASEALGYYAQGVTSTIAANQLAEMNRSNRAKEASQRYNDLISNSRQKELVRHNLATERLTSTSTKVNAVLGAGNILSRLVTSPLIGGK